MGSSESHDDVRDVRFREHELFVVRAKGMVASVFPTNVWMGPLVGFNDAPVCVERMRPSDYYTGCFTPECLLAKFPRSGLYLVLNARGEVLPGPFGDPNAVRKLQPWTSYDAYVVHRTPFAKPRREGVSYYEMRNGPLGIAKHVCRDRRELDELIRSIDGCVETEVLVFGSDGALLWPAPPSDRVLRPRVEGKACMSK